ncbi:hypothetical protein AAZX31_20G100800 [Glycine max]
MTNKGKGKGKEVAGKGSAGKRKGVFQDDKTGSGCKRNNRSVLQFFEDAADVEESDFSDFSDDDDSDFDFSDDELNAAPRRMDMPDKGQSSLPRVVPKEEMLDEEEWDRILEERYKDPSRFIRFSDEFGDDKGMDPSSIHEGVDELTPSIWKVKCTVGRERLSALCLMQKFADLYSLGTKLKIKSAFSVDHMKGFVYIEAEKQYDINEACQGIPGIYVTRVAPVPNSEVYNLFSVRSRTPEISEGMWARIKGGNYKGDLAQVVSVNNTRKKVTVKLIPRIDLQALAAKFGGGYSRQKMAVPAPRLISSSELEEFRPLIQIKRDRDTGKVFEVLDGLMLKDGYVYKKISPDSLSLWGVVPTEDELLKFGPSENNDSNDLEWLSQLYGDKKKKRVIRPEKGGGGKGESSSGSGVGNGFELYDLVCFGKKDFGVIVGMDKDDIYKILKEGSDGPDAVTVDRHEIKSGLFDLKLTALDQHSKTILVNDTVRVLEGPTKGKQGIVKHIYRGIVFLYDGNEEENGGYLTCKSNKCEKVKLAVGDCSGKDSEPGPLVFEDQPSSPRSPLSPKKPWQARENNREFNRGDNNNMFTIGQTLRIRIGPLKGYICRVIALRRADVTVKLDSQQKVLTVKCEHLSEVQGKSTAISSSGVKQAGNTAGTSDIDANQDAGWKNKPNKDGSESSGWETKNNWNAPVSSSNDKVEKGNDQGRWNAGKASGGLAADFSQASGWKGGLSEHTQEGSNWGDKKFGSCDVSGDSSGNQGSNGWGQKSNWNSGSRSGNENQNSHWSSGRNEPGNQDSNLDKKSNWNSGNSGNLASDPKSSNWNSGSGNSNENSNWGTNVNNKSSWGTGNENKNSSWSSGHSDPGNQDANQGKKSNWNSGNSGNQPSDPNSNWNSNKSSWSAGNENKKSNWSSGDPGNTDSNWGNKNNCISGSGDANQNTSWRSNSSWNTANASSDDGNEGSNENSDGVGGGNWRGGYRGRGGSDRGGFRGRGFRGRGERGGFGGRGEHGGFGGRGERGGFGGRGRSDREGFGGRWGSEGGRGGRGRGRNDQSGGWNNRRDSGEDGPSDWKKGADNGGWKNSNGSQAWNQDTGDKDRQSWSQGNADKEHPSWNQGSGRNQSWSSASGANDNGSQAWNQGNADKEHPSWNQAGNKQSWSSASGGGNNNWNNNGSSQTAEASWKKSTTEGTNIQGGGWNKGSSSNTTSKDWGQSSAADKGQASCWKEAADGASGSWGKKNDGGDKGGW